MLSNFDFKDTDTRVRKYITAQRIVKTHGDVENADILLEYRNRQIELYETSVVKMTTERGSKAGILLDFGTEFHGGAAISVYSTHGVIYSLRALSELLR